MADEERESARRRLAVISRHLQPCSFKITHCSATVPRNYPHYRYTLDDGTLPAEARDFYEVYGYYVVKNLVPQEELDRYTTRFQEICNGAEKPAMMIAMKDINSRLDDGERAINKLQDFVYDPVLSDYCRLPQILKVVQNFTGPDIKAIHTMLINKPPDTGKQSSRHPLHQDLHYFPFRPAERIVASWTAMQKVTRENGCLVVLPKTHKGELLQHDYPKWEGGVNKLYHGIVDFDPSIPRVHLEMEPGDTVFFHPLLIHGSGMNRTKGFRKAISCHFASSFCHYIDVRGTIQENMADEIMKTARRRVGDDLEFALKDWWKEKRVLIQGRDGTL